MDGSWDMFHAGHSKTLKKIKTQLVRAFVHVCAVRPL